jgi:hypothetical protein
MVIVPYYRGYRIEVDAEHAWNVGVRIRRTLSDEKPHVETITCRKATAMEAEQAGEIWAQRWVDRHANEVAPR